MALEARIRELVSRHKTLKGAVADEIRRPASDPLKVLTMKKEKLRLKDEIETLSRRQDERAPA